MTKKVLIAVILALGVMSPARSQVQEPTNAQEAKEKAEKAAKDAGTAAKYQEFVAKLPPAEQAWEVVLQENLGGFYLPLYQADKVAGRQTAWDFVKDDPALPRVLLIGDSISRGYTQTVRKELAGKANVHRAPENCGPTANGLRKLAVWLGKGKWDVIHFNFGIHDRRTPSEVYEANLEKIVADLEETGAKLVWANTTPPSDAGNNEKFTLEQCERLNGVADTVMKRHGIAITDLSGLVKPRLAELQLEKNVHFNPTGYQVLGRQVAEGILGKLVRAAPGE